MHTPRSVLLGAGTFALALLAAFALGSSSAFADTSSTAAAVESNVTSFMTQQLDSYQGSVYGPFQGGVWTDPEDTTCWACDDGGPATAAATLYVLTGASNPALLDDAEETIDTAIADDQNSDGSFNPTNAPANVGNPIWFGDELGTTFRLLEPYLTAETLAHWQAALSADANYLINSGNTTWYINGNLNLAETELLWLAWQATGNPAFEMDYTNSWGFIVNPPQTEFPGTGWVTVQSPTEPDGSNGEGYFTETGAGGTGWDPYYATLQLDVATRLYLFSGDPRALRVANMIMNLESPLIDRSDWTINTSDGTRHTGMNGSGLVTSAYAVLGFEGGRYDLVADALPQIEQEEGSYSGPGQNDPSSRRAFGNSVALVALAAALADPAISSTVTQYGPLGAKNPTQTSASMTDPPAAPTPTTILTTTPATTAPTTSPPSTILTPSSPPLVSTKLTPTLGQELAEDLDDAESYARDADDLRYSTDLAHGRGSTG
jgi:hypothetical protein